ncbi:hypothetical protein HK101_000367, partial [Irineochytrium annulatum]
AKLSFLEGERRGMENIKTDLLRRVKMLEYALRQERGKYLSRQQQASDGQPNENNGPNFPESDVPGSVQQQVESTFANDTPGHYNNGAGGAPGGTLLGYSKGVGNLRSREILKKCVALEFDAY